MITCVEGPIGVGKTTLVNAVVKRMNATAVYEDFGNNPFLLSHYKSPMSFSLHVQFCFLLLQHAKLRELIEKSKNYICDFSILKTAIFSTLLLSPEERQLIDPVYTYLKKTINPPDMIIYLHGPDTLMMKRIRQRNRPRDTEISLPVIAQLSSAYEWFFATYKETPWISRNIRAFDCQLTSHVDDLIHEIQGSM